MATVRCGRCDEVIVADGGECAWCGHLNPAPEPTPDGPLDAVVTEADQVKDPPHGESILSVEERSGTSTDRTWPLDGARVSTCDHSSAGEGAVICPECAAVLATPAAHPAEDVVPDRAADPAPRPVRVILEFPWGEHALEPGHVVDIGRAVGPFERLLEPYLTVGRRHAIVRLTERGTLLVRDNASTNGTFVDAVRCGPTGEVEVPDGAELRFSSALRVRVRFER